MSKFPIIVIEGPDGVGKTTLSDALCEYLGAKYLHLTYRFKDRMHLYHGAALSYALKIAETRPVVVDRWWASEVVYAKAYRGGTQWPLLRRHVERVALRHGLSYVFCLPADKDAYLDHFNRLKGERVEMYDSGMDRVYDGFADVYNDLSLSGRPGVFHYDFFKQGSDLPDVIQSVVETSADLRAQISWLDDSMWLSGNLATAEHLVVAPVPREVTIGEMPMVSPTTEALSWSQALDAQGVHESHIAYAYLTGDNFADIRSLARHMRVVALGHETCRDLTMRGVYVNKVVEHPRSWGHPRRHALALHGVFDV